MGGGAVGSLTGGGSDVGAAHSKEDMSGHHLQRLELEILAIMSRHDNATGNKRCSLIVTAAMLKLHPAHDACQHIANTKWSLKGRVS